MGCDSAIKGTPVYYDDEGRPVSPRWAPAPEAPVAEKREDTGSVTLRLRKWLAIFEEIFADFAEDMGCEVDVMVLLMAGLVSQDIQIVADAMKRSTRWVRPRVNRLRKMGMWLGDETLGPRYDSWEAALTGDFTNKTEDEATMGILVDTMEVDGLIKSRRDASGKLRFHLTAAGRKAE